MIPIDDKTYKADNGMKLTNSETFVDIIYLGTNDSIDNWHEITEEEAERLQNEEIESINNKAIEANYVNALN